MSTRSPDPGASARPSETSILDLEKARGFRERAQRLGRVLGLPVEVDMAGWLRDEVEIVLLRRDAALVPVAVRVGRDAIDDSVTGPAGIRQLCHRYNAALDRLRGLAARLAELVRHDRIAVPPGSGIAYAVHELSRLELLIRSRQRAYMSNGVVRLRRLLEEIDYFGRCDAHLAPIVAQAESSIRVDPSSSRTALGEAAPGAAAVASRRPSSARRWFGWMRWPRRGGAA